jgi:DNA-binding CsgD family transcriptional regulator/mannose-6-phosphate isomerase-like protein (cupin superfamily)
MPISGIRAVHWFTERTADALRDPPAHALSRLPLVPPAGATTFQIIVVPPERERTPERVQAFYASAFGENGAARDDADHRTGMHRTATIDYIVVLEGEVVLILEDEEVVLRPFDTVVQRSTRHGWTNRGSTPAAFAVVTVDLATAGIVAPEQRRALEFAALFGLTPAETEVALALAHGARLVEIASSRKVSLNTIRTLATRLRSKLGVRSQAEIVRIVMLHLGAFADPPRSASASDS